MQDACLFMDKALESLKPGKETSTSLPARKREGSSVTGLREVPS